MNRVSLIIAVVCFSAGATAVMLTGRAGAQAERAKAARPVYEYKVFGTHELYSKEKELNQLGAAGWELVVAIPSTVVPNLTISSSAVQTTGRNSNVGNLSSVAGKTTTTREGGYLLFRRQK
jgi:hypothetical protein